MKTVFLSGRLTADPEVRTVGEAGKRLATFSIDNNETDKESGEFYDVRCWEKVSELASSYLKKGNKVVVQGSFNNESYTDKEGKERTKFVITAHKIEFASEK